MGYNTNFEGRIEIDPPLNNKEINYLIKFSQTRHMTRGLGPYWVTDIPYQDSNKELDVKNCNIPPPSQPGLWCNFEPSFSGTALVWNEAEKTYGAVEWIQYIIDHFLKPGAITQVLAPDHGIFQHFQYNHIRNGEFIAQGEDPEDRWKLKVTNNVVKKIHGRWVFEE